ncbi:MAG: hypothetical protein KC656_17530, partial [Myxococcales bacterium]|nr:hypothetical protein [Myxococcales bacterium]
MLVALGSALAAEPGFDASGMTTVPLDADPRDPLFVERPGVMQAGDAFAGAMLGYARGALDTPDASLNDVGYLGLSLGAALHPSLRVDLLAPIALATSDAGGWHGPAMGDIRLRTLISVLPPEAIEGGGGAGLGLVGFVDLPSGAVGRNLGWGEPSGGMKLAGTYEGRRFTLTADAGFAARPTSVALPDEGGATVMAGVAAGVLATDDLGITAEAGLRMPLDGTLGLD